MRNIIQALAGAALAAICLVGNAAASPSTEAVAAPAALRVLGTTTPPIGHLVFCRANPQDCTGDTSTPASARLTGESWRELNQINGAVNALIAPVTDDDLYGRPEHWTYPVDRGDCEDYALLKRKLLIERGWPSEALLMTVVRERDGEGHAVLTVLTDRGEFILDNKVAEIRAWSQTHYRFVKRQSRTDPKRWVALESPAHNFDTPASASLR